MLLNIIARQYCLKSSANVPSVIIDTKCNPVFNPVFQTGFFYAKNREISNIKKENIAADISHYYGLVSAVFYFAES